MGANSNLYAISHGRPAPLGSSKVLGAVFPNDVEMQYTSSITCSIGSSVEHRPTDDPTCASTCAYSSLIVACSPHGDNNCRPAALAIGFSLDPYRNDLDVLGHDQTIVHASTATASDI